MTDTITIPAGELCHKHVGWMFEGKIITAIFARSEVKVERKNDFNQEYPPIEISAHYPDDDPICGTYICYRYPTDLVTLRKPEVSPCR
jgi:hypothetical protein